MSFSTLDSIARQFAQAQPEQACNSIQTLLKSGTHLGDQALKIARLAQQFGEVDLAIRAAQQFAKCHTQDPFKHLMAAAILAEMGQTQTARHWIEQLQNTLPYHFALQHFIATTTMQLGELSRARAAFKTLLTHWPQSGQSWLSYSALIDYSAHPQELSFILQASAAIAKSPDVSRAAYHYALGKAYFECGETKQAWYHYQAGATIMRVLQPYDAKREKNVVETLIASYRADSFARLGASSVEQGAPIFVLGWPRSGTTLVEHMLCTHHEVVGGGELDLMRKATVAMQGMGCHYALRYQAMFKQADHAWNNLAARYRYLASQRLGKPGQVVDKTLTNSRFVGLLARMFPSAPIIYLKRTPADAALSCYRTFFSANQPWSWDLADIARHFKLEEQLLSHWQAVLPHRILSVPYEQLVRAPQEWQRKISQFCQLTELNPSAVSQVPRAVTTASTVQVRQSIHTRSIGLGESMGDYLQDFKLQYACER